MTSAQTNAMLSTHHSAIYRTESPKMSAIYTTNSEESWEQDSDDMSDDSYEEESVVRRWYLRLPIHGNVALRRAIQRGDDPFQIHRQQRSQLHHEMELRRGPLRNINTTFHSVDFGKGMQQRSRMSRILAGEPISPGSLPRPEQMSLSEFESVFGKVVMGDDWEDTGAEELVQEPFDLLDYSYLPTLSAPVEEGFFSEDPFNGRRKTKGDFDNETPADRYDRF